MRQRNLDSPQKTNSLLSHCVCQNIVFQTSDDNIICRSPMLWCSCSIGYTSKQTMNTASLCLDTHETSVTNNQSALWQCQTSRWVGHQKTSDIQPSEKQGRGFCPVVFIGLKCSAKMEAGCLSQPDAVSKETMTDFLGYIRYFSLDTAHSFGSDKTAAY